MEKMTKIGEAVSQAEIRANINSINISEWLFGLTSKEYEACAKGHQSAAQGTLPSGKRVSVNVEHVAGFFMIQHYVETVSEKDRVLVVSPNTVLWLDDQNYVIMQITWELTVKKIDNLSSLLTCKVITESANQKFVQASKDLSKEIDPKQSPFQLHINEETPLFARDIEKKAIAGEWQ